MMGFHQGYASSKLVHRFLRADFSGAPFLLFHLRSGDESPARTPGVGWSCARHQRSLLPCFSKQVYLGMQAKRIARS
jgi:hypothetical protein